jgi:ABC-type nitrate/sulfonate/bicarbonate transport system ATPase subunit
MPEIVKILTNAKKGLIIVTHNMKNALTIREAFNAFLGMKKKIEI